MPTSGHGRLILTAGEPAGIGPELCLQIAATALPVDVIVVADPRILHDRAEKLGLSVEISEWNAATKRRAPPAASRLSLLPIEFPKPDCCGRPDPENAQVLLAGLSEAAQRTLAGEFDALVTGPVQKSTINAAGIPFSGHTEFLADTLGAGLPVMMLTAGTLRVALATTHLPLGRVAAAIDGENLKQVIRILNRGLIDQYGIVEPHIIVCGLNPHAGEDGHLGNEEKNIIEPALAELRREGMTITGPLPADTAFTPAAGRADVVLAMYHDQGLPVVKYAGFGRAVNVTLGLPIVRTSVDHGTALDLAGSGQADPGSLLAAIQEANMLLGRG